MKSVMPLDPLIFPQKQIHGLGTMRLRKSLTINLLSDGEYMQKASQLLSSLLSAALLVSVLVLCFVYINFLRVFLLPKGGFPTSSAGWEDLIGYLLFLFGGFLLPGTITLFIYFRRAWRHKGLVPGTLLFTLFAIASAGWSVFVFIALSGL